MSNVDVTKLSYAQLVDLSKQLERQIAEKRSEELKVLVDGFAKKLEAAGFTVAEGAEALKPYLPVASHGGKTAPVRYRNPANPADTWSGRGRAPKWLADLEAQGRGREEFRAV
ncbi:H-NS histone family protein [Roseateles sp.]|uniref:H-NS histone family protein n=1 Tax=Roseateles sp. TaxID=1971397 RepID=UPI0031D2BF0B